MTKLELLTLKENRLNSLLEKPQNIKSSGVVKKLKREIKKLKEI